MQWCKIYTSHFCVLTSEMGFGIFFYNRLVCFHFFSIFLAQNKIFEAAFIIDWQTNNNLFLILLFFNRVSHMWGSKTYIRGCVSSDQIIPGKNVFSCFVKKRSWICARICRKDCCNRAIGENKKASCHNRFRDALHCTFDQLHKLWYKVRSMHAKFGCGNALFKLKTI